MMYPFKQVWSAITGITETGNPVVTDPQDKSPVNNEVTIHLNRGKSTDNGLVFSIHDRECTHFPSAGGLVQSDSKLVFFVESYRGREKINLPEEVSDRLSEILSKGSSNVVEPSVLVHWNTLLLNGLMTGGWDLKKILPVTCHQFANFVRLGDRSYNDLLSYMKTGSIPYSKDSIKPGDKITVYASGRKTNLCPEHSMIYLGEDIVIHKQGRRAVCFSKLADVLRQYQDSLVADWDFVIHRPALSVKSVGHFLFRQLSKSVI